MVQALGYSLLPFEPAHPDRLCRGRERWIAPIPFDEPPPPVERLVVTGASFSDDTAQDARRGLRYSGIPGGEVIRALLGGVRPLLAFAEQGERLAVPPGAWVEEYEQPAVGGRVVEQLARWRLLTAEPERWTELVQEGPGGADGFVPCERPGCPPVPPALEDALYLLTGLGDRKGRPARRFQPSAIPDVLEQVPFLLCVHLDKHAPALALYGHGLLAAAERVVALAEERGVLPVPFTIPPMLARWDRALYELRLAWRREGRGELPVPRGEGGYAASYEFELPEPSAPEPPASPSVEE